MGNDALATNSFSLDSSSRRASNERAPFRVPIHARFWCEWSDQHASSPEGPCVVQAFYRKWRKVPRSYSDADECASLFTEIGMTSCCGEGAAHAARSPGESSST